MGLPTETADTLAQKAVIKADSSSPPLFVLDKDYLLALVETPRPEPLPQKNRPIPARDKGAPLKVLEEEPAQPASDAEGFLQYFQSRYDRLEAILKRRVDVKDAIPIEQALKLPIKTKLKTIGIVAEKRTRGSKLFIELEDRRSTISVMASDEEVMRQRPRAAGGPGHRRRRRQVHRRPTRRKRLDLARCPRQHPPPKPRPTIRRPTRRRPRRLKVLPRRPLRQVHRLDEPRTRPTSEQGRSGHASSTSSSPATSSTASASTPSSSTNSP